MKQIILTAVLLAILNVATVPARAATFYVNGATGNDNNSGSTSAPWKSISKAANTLAAGDTVIIRAGAYRETVTPLNSGTAANPITYKAEPGAEVIISGTDPLSSTWSQHSGNIYKTSVQLPLGDGAQLFVNGNMMMEACWPNNPGAASDATWLVERNLSTATEGTEIIPPPAIPTRYSIVGGEINVAVPVGSRVFISTMLGHGWVNYTCEVAGYDPGLKKITFDVPFVLEPNQNKVSYTGGANPRKSRFFLHGDLSYLDMEKEYFYDSDTGTLYLYQPGGGSPSANSVEYKVRNTGINLDGRKFINLEGIELFACNLISNSTSGNIIVDDLKADYPSHWSTSAVPSDIVGIKLFGSNNVIRNSDISYSMGHGIHVSGDNTKILNNEVTDCGYLGIYRNNIWVDGSHHVVSYNTALRSGRSILGGKFANTKISNNEFAYANYLSADGACMYLGFWDTGNSEISHNYVHHTGDPASTTGIYFDNYCHNAIIHHNHTEGMQINGPRSGMTIVNNTIVGRGLVWDYWVKDSSGQYIYADDGAGTYIANNIVSRNLMNLNRIPAIYDMMNWDENQRGVGTAKVLSNGDLSSDSPCIDVSGVETLPHIHSNVTDGKPDLGAFEYGVARWEYGHDFSTSREEQLEVFDFPLMNQMKNPGFELGVNGWTNVFQSISAGKRGKAARITGNSSIYQTVAGLKPNTTYTISAWSKDGTPVMEVSGYGGVNVSEAGDVLSTVWTLNELEITTGPSNTSAIVHLKNNGAGFVDWDQAGVYIHLQNRQVGDPPPSGRLLIWTSLAGGNATGSWAAQANWSGGTLATTTNDTADFSRLNLTAASTVSLNGNQAINKLLFADATTASHDWTVAAGTPSTSTLTLGGTTPEISVTNRTATISAKLTGSANWTKKGAGTLRLSNTTNSFTGDVTVSGGTLAVAGGNAIPDSGKLVIHSGGKVDPSGTTETVGTLFFGGVQQIAGTWGSTTSTATNKNNTYFTGTGVVLVTSGQSVTVTVTFDAQSGTVPSPASKSVTVGSPYGTLAATSRSGYTFAGWWTGAGGTGSEVTAATVANTASNHTLYAKWTASTPPPSPTGVATQSSTGWGGEAARAIDGNTNGNWGQNSVTHTLSESNPWWTLDRGESSFLTHIKIWNRTDAVPERLSDFYVFVSDEPFASTDPAVLAASSGVWDFYHSGAVGEFVTIPVGTSGRYIRIQIPGANKVLSLAEAEVFVGDPPLPTYAVTYHANGSTSGSIPAAQTKTQGVALTLSANTGSLAKTGYSFAGWNTAANGTGTNYAVSSSYTTDAPLTLYAKWTANSYTVTFDAQSGALPSPASKSVTIGSPYGTLATTTRSGYTFAGWWTGAGGTGSEVTAATVVSTASNHTLYAKWTANTYTVTFDAQSGAVPSPASKSVTIGSPYGTLATTTRSGYTFAGWWTGAGGTGSEVTAATVASTASNHTLYAKWAADNTPGTFTWTKLVSGNATGSWVDQANWSGGTLATTTNDTADFSTLNITAASTVSLNGSQEINKLLFADATTASHDWTVASGTPSTSTLTLGGTTSEISVTNRTAIISAKLAGSVGWTKTGAGTLRLTNTSNSISGDVTVQTGMLDAHRGSLGTTAGKTYINSTGSTTTGGQLSITGNGVLYDEAEEVVIQGTGSATGSGPSALRFGGGAGSATTFSNMNGAITLDGNANYKIDVYLQPTHWKINGGIARTGANTGTLSLDLNHWQQTAPVRLTINSTIDNNGGPVTLLGNSAGILQMDVAGHDLGDFTVNGAYNLTPTNYQTILKLGISDALSTTKNLTLTKGTFDLAGFNQTVNALSGVLNASLITNSGSTASTLTIGNGGGSGTFSGVISDGVAAISLEKTGSGIQTLAEPNTYSGDTTVAGGTLVLKQVNTSNESASVTIAAGAVLGLDFAGTDTVGKLFLGTPAVQVPAGTYNASHPTYGAYFSFGGSLVVSSGFASNSAPSFEGLATWITGSFAGGVVPEDQQGPNDDPDGDGISNLIEYAIAGQDPTVPNAAVGTFSGLTLSFNKRQPPATDISYVIETSPNLLPPWTARVTHIAPGNTDATISHTLPAGQGKIFARLRITHP